MYKEYDLDYAIATDGEIIARFKNMFNRDDCLYFMQQRISDSKFKAVNQEDLV